MALYTYNWVPLTRNVYFRKEELYSMEWENIDLSDYKVAAAQFGGPIALYRDERKFKRVTVNAKPVIAIYTSSGQLMSSIPWASGRLIHLAWSSSEDLMCITEEGKLLSYDMHGKTSDVITLGQEAEDTKIIECKVFNNHRNVTGVSVLTGAYHIFVVSNVKDARVLKMPNVPGLNAPPTSWAVVADERTPKVLVAKDTQLYVLDHTNNECVLAVMPFSDPKDTILEMAVSINQQHIAFFLDSGFIRLCSSNLKKKYFEIDTEHKSRPNQLVWCANDAVVGFWPNQSGAWLMKTVYSKSFMNQFYLSPVHLISEIDGIRIISNTLHEFLQKVPDAVEDVFKIGSLSSSALLLEASKAFEQKNHKADEYMRTIRERNDLETAVKTCIQAAGHEFHYDTQKMLLKAAYFGKCFVPDMDSEAYVKMCKTLRVLNQIRLNIIGLPLTFGQYEYLTLRVLLDRLVLRHHYALAIQICKYMGIPETEGRSRILSHWACYKVKKTALDPDRTARDIAEKLGHTPGISYAEISNKAYDNGQKNLSVKLLEYETRASEQVPLLIKLEQVDLAMNKAIESGDTDLVFTVILYMEKNLRQRGKFYMKIREFPEAYALYIKFYKDENFAQLKETYYQESDFNSDADWHIMEGYRLRDFEQRMKSMNTAVESYRKAKNEFTAQITEEQVKLMRYQAKLEEKQKEPYKNLSLHQTIKKMLILREYDWADELRKEFRVPDRRFWWLKITVLAEGGEWLELQKFSKSKKSPIGYEPFVDVCMKYGSALEAKNYLPKVKEENKIKYCVKAGALEEAAKAAFSQKDVNALTYIQGLCGIMDRTLTEKIMTMKSQLGSKR